MDLIGRIPVPGLVDSGLTFPLKPDAGFGLTQDSQIVTHQFGSLDAKVEQRFAVGMGPRKFTFRRQNLNLRDRATLAAFWESVGGSWKSFTYNAPNPDQTLSAVKVTWEYAPLAIQYLVTACQVGTTFVEVPDPAAAPAYAVASTCLRFPSSTLQTALLSQVQQIVPLVRIRVRESAVADIFLSDRALHCGRAAISPARPGTGRARLRRDPVPGHQGRRRQRPVCARQGMLMPTGYSPRLNFQQCESSRASRSALERHGLGKCGAARTVSSRIKARAECQEVAMVLLLIALP